MQRRVDVGIEEAREDVLALAAGLLLAVSAGAWNWWLRGADSGPQIAATGAAGSQPGSPVVGTLRPLVEQTAWSFGRAGANNSSEFHQGDTIWLEAGAAELRFASDTVAVLESPVIMQVLSMDRVRVIDGGVKVEVAKGAEGFSVETDAAEVIDLGTVFSVNVENGNTDLVVFDGEVDLKVTPPGGAGEEQPQSPAKRFRAGEAVQVSHDGTLSRIVNVRQSSLPSIGGSAEDEPLIASVRDNNVRADFYSFYEIVPGGMREDAKAFVDRPHEWNGIHSAGMPAYLVSGDYVKTFNNDKVIDALSIHVTLSRPAVLYVLFDKRLRPPKWLRESFEDTGDEIGMDEVHFRPDDPEHYQQGELRVGAGQGVNRTHSIWKREVPQGGMVRLGANGELVEAPPEGVMSKANMYGIVAVSYDGHH
ncbi:MAG: FecR domain-containing protein [Planctomycetales bacterium]|nr:FecR domain-containing protein [Planctomycetales bacterium]